ncbi:AzlD domain-containing protein [Lachnobacterium bovis]|jgi:branched-subunit amino acid transport protein|uniref:Branched-chain amino acid transport protein (AzlD) n=1 Tax=Lachnobacterium bovis DSM 14045 TaxID=1122142 RepID=A0A1H3L9P5_9FIRM|nr:AzlD domain-containing protein [Lachnobacterium bovis]SDY61153.1 Branched-chain amino acid transport protein (AzlD) [Lachnobacterium bovis DSM 14045]
MSKLVPILIMIATIYSVRCIPMLVFRHNIKNKFIKSFLHYVPYVTLAVMTFPAIIYATDNKFAGVAALIIGVILSYITENLFVVATMCCVTVLCINLIG